jgi:hypothetical protein
MKAYNAFEKSLRQDKLLYLSDLGTTTTWYKPLAKA